MPCLLLVLVSIGPAASFADMTEATGQVVATFHAGPVTGLAVSPDGNWLVSGSTDRMIHILDLRSGQRSRVERADAAVSAIGLGPGGRFLAWGDEGGNLGLAGLEETWLARRIDAHRGPVTALAFLPDGSGLLSSSQDGSIRKWSSCLDSEQAVYSPHRADPQLGDKFLLKTAPKRGITALAVSPDGLQAVTASDRLSLRFWDVATGQPAAITPVPGPVQTLAFSPNGARILAACGGIVPEAGTVLGAFGWVMDTATREERCTLNGHARPLTAAVFSPDGRWVATSSEDGTVRLWNGENGKPVSTWDAPDEAGAATAVAFGPDGSLVYSGWEDGSVRAWPLPPSSSSRIKASRLATRSR